MTAKTLPDTTLSDTGFLDLDPLRLEYRMIGPRPDAAPTIVMLHEASAPSACGESFPDAIAEAEPASACSSIRAPATGKSNPVRCRAQSRLRCTRKPALCCRACSTPSASSAACCSATVDGASIATIYAGSVQDHRVRGLVLMAPHFFIEDMGIAEIECARDAFDAGTLREKLKRWHADVDCAFRSWSEPWLHPDFPQVGHHGSARLHPRADPGRARRRRSIRHTQAGRSGGTGMLLSG